MMRRTRQVGDFRSPDRPPRYPNRHRRKRQNTLLLGAMKAARSIGAYVVGLCSKPDSVMIPHADTMIEAITGPEVIMGSTRMKSGTAQKLILNMLTTASMIRSGKVYRNLMIDLNPSNEKLVIRAKRTFSHRCRRRGDQYRITPNLVVM